MWTLIAKLALWFSKAAALWPSRSRRLRYQLVSTNVAIDAYMQDKNDVAAADLIPQYLKLAREVYGDRPTGDDAAHYMMRRAELGCILCKYCESQHGLDVLEESLQWFRSTSPTNDRLWSACYVNLALVLMQLDRDQEAVDWLNKARTVRTAAGAQDSFEMGQCWNNLGVAYQHLRQFQEAEAAGREALRLHELNMGKNSPQAAMALNNLSETLLKAGRADEAVPLITRAIKIAENDQVLLGSMLDTLADVYEAQGKLQEAYLARERALQRASQQQKADKYVEWSEKQIALLDRLGKLQEKADYQRAVKNVQRKAHFHFSDKEQDI